MILSLCLFITGVAVTALLLVLAMCRAAAAGDQAMEEFFKTGGPR